MPEPSQQPLSRAMRELWGLGDDGRRGPKPAMTVAAIADEAVALADAEGLDAVTMAAVAKRLGYTTMSLYRYVESRQDLLAAMLDRAFGPPPEPTPRRAWRRRVEEWARAEAARIAAHPWVLEVNLPSPPVSPNMVDWTEAGFAALGSSGLPPQVVGSALLVIDGTVRSCAQLARQYGGPEAEAWAGRLRGVIDAESHPALAGALAAGVLEDDPATLPPEQTLGEAELTLALTLLLDGLERML